MQMHWILGFLEVPLSYSLCPRSFAACETLPLVALAVLALGIYGEKLVRQRGRSFFFRKPARFVAKCFVLLV